MPQTDSVVSIKEEKMFGKINGVIGHRSIFLPVSVAGVIFSALSFNATAEANSKVLNQSNVEI